MGFKFDTYAPKERELPSEMEERCRREHPEWYTHTTPLTSKEKRQMDAVGFNTGSRPSPAANITQQDVPARFPVRQAKGDLESDRPAARPDPSPFKLGK